METMIRAIQKGRIGAFIFVFSMALLGTYLVDYAYTLRFDYYDLSEMVFMMSMGWALIITNLPLILYAIYKSRNIEVSQ